MVFSSSQRSTSKEGVGEGVGEPDGSASGDAVGVLLASASSLSFDVWASLEGEASDDA